MMAQSEAVNRETNQTLRRQNYSINIISSDDTRQQLQNLPDKKRKQHLKYTEIGEDKSASISHKIPNTAFEQHVLQNDSYQSKDNKPSNDSSLTSSSIISNISRDGEVSGLDKTYEESSSSVTSKTNPSTNSTTTSRTTTINEIIEIVEEFSSRIQCKTLTNERLNRITKYFTKSRIFSFHQLNALKWINDNMQTIYNDPINACKKLRLAIGNECISIDLAKKVLWSFTKNHTICRSDLIKYFSNEKRIEIRINELSEILKRLIKMNIKRVLFNNSSTTTTVSF